MQQWLMVFHMTGIVFWMGGLLILTRLLVLRTEETDDGVADRLAAITKRLYWGTAVAGLTLTLVTGLWQLIELDWGPLDAKVEGAGFHIKLTLVAALIGVHVWMHLAIAKATKERPKGAGLFKAMHGVVGLLLLGVLISVLVVRPELRQKAREKAVKDAQSQMKKDAPGPN